MENENPFKTLKTGNEEIKLLILDLTKMLTEKTKNRFYSIKEASEILSITTQSIRNHIERGNIKAKTIGNRILIPHNELFDSLNDVKSYKYKR